MAGPKHWERAELFGEGVAEVIFLVDTNTFSEPMKSEPNLY